MAGQNSESFGMVVFAAQLDFDPDLFKAKTHTFAAFLHIKPDSSVQVDVISWLPADGKIIPVLGWIQEGRNFDLPQTLSWCKNLKLDVFAWHPFEITEELYKSVIKRIEALNSGKFKYYFYGMQGRFINCTHALSDLELLGDLGGILQSGVKASRICLDRMKKYTKKPTDPTKYLDPLKLPDNIRWLDDYRVMEVAEFISAKQYMAKLLDEIPEKF